MKKVLLLGFSLALFGLPVGAQPDRTPAPAAIERPHRSPVSIPKHAVAVAQDVFSLGTATFRGETVEGFAFIHKKPVPVRSAGGGKAKTACYSFLANGARWKVTESYVLDTANDENLSDDFIATRIAAGFGTWDAEVPFPIFGSRGTGTVDGADTSAPDGTNEVYFGPIADPSTIAITTVWGIFSGPTFNRKIVEYDVVFNDPDYRWGDAGPTSETTLGDTSVMDVLNIAVHEQGHAAGMGHPSDACAAETMYRFGQAGETKKRTLHTGDIAGIKKLYQ